VGAAHPIPKTPGRKLNPLQQLTYLALLNILLPFQIVTGTLIWGAQRWPELSLALGGLNILTPLHNLGSWLFLSFTLGHIYLTSTGHTVSSNLKAMVDGWDEVDPAHLDGDKEDGHD
jgi:thiosulfate reductase cytochrome b subunit